MRNSLKVSVTLHPVDASKPPALILINMNRHGQLPAVLVDPVDRDGHVVQGTWLGDDLGERTDGTSYIRLR